MSFPFTEEAEAAELSKEIREANTNQDLETPLEVQRRQWKEIEERLKKSEGYRENAQVLNERLKEQIQETQLELESHMTKNQVKYYADFKQRRMDYVKQIEVVRNDLEFKLKTKDEELDDFAKTSASLLDENDELKQSLEKCEKKGDQAAEDLKNCKALVIKLEGGSEKSDLSFKSFQTRKELETTIERLREQVTKLIGAVVGPIKGGLEEPEQDLINRYQKVQDLEGKIKDLKNKISEIEKDLAKAQGGPVTTSRAGSGNENHGNLMLKTLETENADLQRRLKESEKQVAERDLKIIGLDEDLHTALGNVRKRIIENEDLEDKLEEREAEIDTLKKKQVPNSGLTTQLEALKSKNSTLAEQLEEQQISNAELKTQLEALKSLNTTLTGQVQEQLGTIGEMITELAAVQAENTKLVKDLAELRASFGRLTAQLKAAQAEIAQVTERLEAQGNVGELKRQLEDLEEKLERCRCETWEARKVRVAQEAKKSKQEVAAQERKERNKNRNVGKAGKDNSGGDGGGKKGDSKRGRDDDGGGGDFGVGQAEGPFVKRTKTKT